MVIPNFYKTITAEKSCESSFSGTFLLKDATGDTFLRKGIPGMDWKLEVNVRHEANEPHKSPKLELNYGRLLSGGETNEGRDQTAAGELVAHVQGPQEPNSHTRDPRQNFSII